MNTSSAANTALIWSERFCLHDTAGYPESPGRIGALRRALTAAGMFDDRLVLEPQPVTLDALAAVHLPALVELVRRAAEQGPALLDADTVVSPGSYEVALLAAGAACAAVETVLSGAAPRAFALGRPPGHHAEPNRAMGFCLFNNVAIGARYLQRRFGIRRVLVVDWDVHHGNGTEATFWSDPSVLFTSTHQYPFYPGTGAAGDRGAGPGDGYTLNVPLPAGAGDERYLAAFEEQLLPALWSFEPQLVLISAGFDAHQDDPLAMMRMTTRGFARLAALVQAVAEECCDGRVALVLEGGYNLDALGASVVAVVRALDGFHSNAGVDR